MDIMKYFLFTFSLFLLTFCKPKTEIISGTLFFKSIDFVNVYGLDDAQIEESEKAFAEYAKQPVLTESDKELFAGIQRLKKYGLWKSPYIRLELDDKRHGLVFLTEEDYRSFSQFKHEDLEKDGKKVDVKLRVEMLEAGVYLCHEIIQIDKVDGDTPWQK